MAKKKKAEFSVTKAVKRNARERVGQPKPEKVIASGRARGKNGGTGRRWRICCSPKNKISSRRGYALHE